MAEVTCSLLPTKMREFRAEWASSGSIAEFDFGSGPVTASYTTDVELTDTSLEARPDALSLDYQTGFAFGPIETGSTASGSIDKAWRIQNLYNEGTFTGSVVLSRENDAGDNWRTGSVLFEYSGSTIEEIDLTFDQSARAIVTGDRKFIVASISQSQVWLYRFDAGEGAFIFTGIATGSTSRVMLDDPIDTANSDVLVFYVKSVTSEAQFGSWGVGQFIAATGSGTSGVFSSSYQDNAITLSLSPYHVSNPAVAELGVFTSKPSTEASLGITGSFNPDGVASIGATIDGPDFAGNSIIAYDSGGIEIGQASFTFLEGFVNKDTKFVNAPSGTFIRTFHLVAADADYVGYDAVYFEPVSGSVSGTFSSQQVYYRQQRDNYAIETPVPLTEAVFLEWVDWMFGSFTGSIGGGEERGVLVGELQWEGYVSGTIIGDWSGSDIGSGSFSGSLTGSASGTILGFASGNMSGTFSGSRGFNDGILDGFTSSSLVAGAEFLYELFLEDVVKLRDNRLSLYVTRRNIDSGSADLGEYRAQKLETLIYPHQIAEDEYTASVSYLTSSLLPLIEHPVFDVDSHVSASLNIESGSMRTILIKHSVFDVDSHVSTSLNLESGSIREIVITHSVFDVDSHVSSSLEMESGSMRQIVIEHTAFDKDSHVSSSMDILSGSLE